MRPVILPHSLSPSLPLSFFLSFFIDPLTDPQYNNLQSLWEPPLFPPLFPLLLLDTHPSGPFKNLPPLSISPPPLCLFLSVSLYRFLFLSLLLRNPLLLPSVSGSLLVRRVQTVLLYRLTNGERGFSSPLQRAQERWWMFKVVVCPSVRLTWWSCGIIKQQQTENIDSAEMFQTGERVRKCHFSLRVCVPVYILHADMLFKITHNSLL